MGTLTKVVVDRLFEEFNTYSGEMDYKTFLDFILAMEYKKSQQSVAVRTHPCWRRWCPAPSPSRPCAVVAHTSAHRSTSSVYWTSITRAT